MNHQNLTDHHLLEKLKNTEPVLDDPGKLSDNIMQEIEQVRDAYPANRIMRVAGLLSGVAASLLIGLLVFETIRYPAAAPMEDPIFVSRQPDNRVIRENYPVEISDLNKSKKTEYLERIIENKEKQRAQRERYSALFLTKNKTTRDSE